MSRNSHPVSCEESSQCSIDHSVRTASPADRHGAGRSSPTLGLRCRSDRKGQTIVSTLASVSVLDLGYYDASRAAALAGMPKSTIYDWSRSGLVVPSGSPTREMLWSYADLLKLRLVRWLRTEKPEVARTRMAEVREALDQLGEDLWEDSGDAPDTSIRVTRSGQIVVMDDPLATLDGQLLVDSVDLFAPGDGVIDLRRPRPKLRIHPGRISGEPHLLDSRLTTRAIAGLLGRGFTQEMVEELYPMDDPEGIAQAVDLELSLGTLALAV